MRKIERVVIIVGQLGNGGLEQQLFLLIKGLIDRKVDVYCIVWNYDSKEHYVSCFSALLQEKLIAFESEKSSLAKLLKLILIIYQNRPNIALSFSAFTNFPVFLCCLPFTSKAVGSLRGSAEHYLKSGGLKSVLNLLFPGRLLINSKKAISELNENRLFGFWLRKTYYGNVISIKDSFLASGKVNNSPYSISVGNVRRVKRLDRMIDLFVYLGNAEKEFRHIHVGGGEELSFIQKRIEEAGLEDRIVLLGSRSDVYRYLEESTVFLHFSEYEGSPNVIMEAMAAGLPIITTDCGDSKEFVLNGVNGYVVSPFDVQTFARHYLDIMSNERLRLKMANSAVAFIAEYSEDGLVDNFMLSLSKVGVNLSLP